MKGKTLSCFSKVFACVFVLGFYLAKVATPLGNSLTEGEIVKVSIFFLLLFSPVDVSIWLTRAMPSKHGKQYTKPKNKRSMKQASLVAKSVSGIFVFVAFSAHSLGLVPNASTNGILIVGAFLASVFLNIDVSLWIEKFSYVGVSHEKYPELD